MSTPTGTERTQHTPDLDAMWGIARARTPRRACRALTRRLPAAVATLAVTVTLLLGLAGTAMVSTSSARADIFGISDAVEDWVCGIVSPTEPWEGVGDGPEALISNSNLAKLPAVPVTVVTAAGERVSIAPSSPDAPASMDQMLALPADRSLTLYEIAGLRGLNWWTIPVTPDGATRSCNLWNFVFSQAGNAVFALNKTLLQVVIAVKEAAAADNPLAFLYDSSGGAVSTAFSVFFVPLAILALICTGIWIAVISLRRGNGGRQAFGAIGAAALIMILAAFAYVANTSEATGFRKVTAVADQVISQINAVATNALFDKAIDGGGACTLPEDTGNAVRGQRITSCMLADSLAYRPWAIGQFGGAGAKPIALPEDWTVVAPAADGALPLDSLLGDKALPCYVEFDGCRELRTYLIAQHGGVQVGERLSGQSGFLLCATGAADQDTSDKSWMQVQTSEGDDVALAPSTPCSPMYRTFQALASTDQKMAAAYAGDVGIARVSQAISSLIGTVVAGLAVLVIGLITMGWIAYTFALWLTGPFKLAFAVYSGKTKIARSWLGDLVHSWASRVAYGIVLSLTILIVTWMLNANLSFGMRLLWLGIILWFFWKLIAKVQEMIRPAAASENTMATDIQGKVLTGGRRTGRSIKAAVTGGKDGLVSSVQSVTDPTRTKRRRTISALSTPLTVGVSSMRGAVTGNAPSRPVWSSTTPGAASPAADQQTPKKMGWGSKTTVTVFPPAPVRGAPAPAAQDSEPAGPLQAPTPPEPPPPAEPRTPPIPPTPPTPPPPAAERSTVQDPRTPSGSAPAAGPLPPPPVVKDRIKHPSQIPRQRRPTEPPPAQGSAPPAPRAAADQQTASRPHTPNRRELETVGAI